jgi:hypothetical protein
MPPALLAFQIDLELSLGLVLDGDPPTSTSQIAGITGVCTIVPDPKSYSLTEIFKKCST